MSARRGAPVPARRRRRRRATTHLNTGGKTVDSANPHRQPSPRSGAAGRPTRILGLDVARAAALIGMMATHLFPIVDDDGSASAAWLLFAGRSFALFVLLAGVGLAFTTGGARPPAPGRRGSTSAVVAARALVLLLFGLALGHFVDYVDVILAAYGALFLLAIALIRLAPRVLVGLAAGITVVVPFVLQWSRDFLPEPRLENPSFATLDRAGALLSELLLTGVYPALPLLAYVCVGLAIGRRLSALAAEPAQLRVFATRLLAGGVVLALVAWMASSLLLHELGGLDRIAEASVELDAEDINDIVVWGPDPTLPTSTSWWLAVRAPHSSTPFDLAHTAGTSMAVLGLALLVVRPGVKALRPVVAAGTMTLTLYSLHVLVTDTSLLGEHAGLSFVLQVTGALVLATAWRDRFGQGPLERIMATAAGYALAAVPTREPAEARTGERR